MSWSPCPQCGTPVRPGAKFCGRCGYNMNVTRPGSPIPPPPLPTQPSSPPPLSPQPGLVRCPSCGSSNRVTAKFCGVCRTPLAVAATTPPYTPPPSYAPPSYSPPAQPPPVLSTPVPVPAARTNWAHIAQHTLVAGGLLVCLLLSLSGVGVYDVQHPAPTATPLVVNTPAPGSSVPISSTPDVVLAIDPIGRYGLRTTTGKLLTFAFDGSTNNTRIQVDGADAIVGAGGTFTTRPTKTATGSTLAWVYREIETRQDVTLAVGATTRRTDTLRIQYTLTNKSAQSHSVALRVMLDTLIGDNDGVPFLLAGESAITTRAKDLRGATVPDFITALEQENISNPGTVVNLAMRGGDATPPDRLVLAHWPGSDAEWEYLSRQGGVGSSWGGDSSAGLYYDAKPLAPNESRTIVFYYGLGGIAASGKLGITVPLEVTESEKFSIIVVVMDPHAGQTAQINLPDSVALGDGETATKDVTVTPGTSFSQVSWKLRAKKPADAAVLSVKSNPDNQTATQTIKILPCGVTRPCNTAP